MWVELDDEWLDEVFPERKTLIGLQFASPDDYERAASLVAAWGPDFYKELYPEWCMIVVRKREAQRFADAGLGSTEIEQVDDEDLDPAEVRARDRALIEYWKPIVRERAQQRQ